MYYIKKDVYLTFCLWHIKISQILNHSARNEATVDVYGICLYILCIFLERKMCIIVIHIGVGFCVARSGGVGYARALMCGTSNRYRFPRFFLYIIVVFKEKKSLVWGSCGHIEMLLYENS